MQKTSKDLPTATDLLAMTKPPTTNKFVFVDRRKGNERRLDEDPCSKMPLDLYHRKRRKSNNDRRDPAKSLSDDYYSYMQKVMSSIKANTRSHNS